RAGRISLRPSILRSRRLAIRRECQRPTTAYSPRRTLMSRWIWQTMCRRSGELEWRVGRPKRLPVSEAAPRLVGDVRHMPACRLRKPIDRPALGSRGGYALHAPTWRARLPRSGPSQPRAAATGTPAAVRSLAREGPMTAALELVGAFLSAATLLTAT